MHLQWLGAVPPDPRVWDLLPVETPFQNSWIRHCTVHIANTNTCMIYSYVLCGHKHGLVDT